MKKLALFLSLFLASGVFAQVERFIPERPNPPRLVNDLSKQDLLSPQEERALEQKLVAYDDSTSSQIAIVIVDDLHDYSAVEYAVALGRKWGVGGSQFNNGVIILVSTGGGAGNRDAFIATGYGLEGAIPDITANTILENELIPNLKTDHYFDAFNQATDAIIKAAAGEYKAPAGYRNRQEKGKGSGFFRIIIALVVLFIVFGAGGGGRGGGFMSRRGYRGFGGGPIIFPGGFGGGGGGFGGGGGGGFGGFGGGGFGGGGAGGKW
ncbi:MAG TPA: TPM domain-containing protein [Flavisolibacter sp.]|nr:TPM domain-containing protein [Flavisolibacter sp.]